MAFPKIRFGVSWIPHYVSATFKNDEKPEHRCFEMLAKVKDGWPIAKSIRKISILVAVLYHCTRLELSSLKPLFFNDLRYFLWGS